MRKAEQAWIRKLVRELKAGQFRWDFKTIVRQAKAVQKLAAKPVKEK